jgi:hypothetical protein
MAFIKLWPDLPEAERQEGCQHTLLESGMFWMLKYSQQLSMNYYEHTREKKSCEGSERDTVVKCGVSGWQNAVSDIYIWYLNSQRVGVVWAAAASCTCAVP